MSTEKKPENQAATAPPGDRLGTSPGRSADAELIRLAAERVMGWTRPEEHAEYADPWWYEPDGSVAEDSDWNPLIFDSDALMLWDKLRTDGWCWELRQSSADAIGCQVEVYRYASETKPAYDKCLPRAITIAALRAVGVDTDKIEATGEMSRGDTEPTPSAQGSQGGSR